MRAIIVIGWKSPSEPAPLYCGVDGVEANKTAQEAQATGGYVRIGKLVNPSYIPMPHVPVAPAETAPAAKKKGNK